MDEFELALNKMSVSGALFDMVKLLDISKTVISRYTKEEVFKEVCAWSEEYDLDLKKMLEDDIEYTLKILGIERGNEKPRKDIAKWSDIKDNIEYMYDSRFLEKDINYEYQNINDETEINKIVKTYIEKYFDLSDDKQIWFNKMKDLAEEFGYAREVKEYKQNPENYKGHVGDISTVIRIALTGRANTPDMYEIMQVLGKNSVEARLKKAIKE
jgi:glutamyl/glutaminyl-tRNA synthetase